MQRTLRTHSKRQNGQGLVEYALILVLVAVVVIGILSALGPSISNIFCTVQTKLGGSCSGGSGGLTVTQSFISSTSNTVTVEVEVRDANGFVPGAHLTGQFGPSNIAGECYAISFQYRCVWNTPNVNDGDAWNVSASANGKTGQASGTIH